MIHTTTWMNLRNIMLSKRSQEQRPCTGMGKSKFTVIRMENNTIINKYFKKNKFCISLTHNCKPTFAPSCIHFFLRVRTEVLIFQLDNY